MKFDEEKLFYVPVLIYRRMLKIILSYKLIF